MSAGAVVGQMADSGACRFTRTETAWTCVVCGRSVPRVAGAVTPPRRMCARGTGVDLAPARPPQAGSRGAIQQAVAFHDDEVTRAIEAEAMRSRLPIGDVVERVAQQLGADRLAGWYTAWTGVDCGCAGRKAWLNAVGDRLVGWLGKPAAARPPVSLPVIVAPVAGVAPPAPPLCAHGPYDLPERGTVAVIVLSHNYGRFLEECLRSILAQSLAPCDVLVVDDGSTDDTAEVAARFAPRVRYLRVDVQSEHGAFAAGFAATRSEWVCRVDADDRLPTRYLEMALAQSGPGVGLVTTDFQNIGERADIQKLPPRDIWTDNWIHAGAVARRVALESVLPFRQLVPAKTLADWYVWRQVTAAGWKVARSPVLYEYRRHGAGRLTWLQQFSHADRAGIAQDELTIILPLSGRRQWWPRMRDWLERQTWPHDRTRLLVLDSGEDASFTREVREWLAGCDYGATQWQRVETGEIADLADRDRRKPEYYRAVQRVMPRIYNAARQSLATPWALIVEDDVLPPADAAQRLLAHMEPDVLAVSGVVWSRYETDKVIAWKSAPGERMELLREAPDGVVTVRGAGFGCLALRSNPFRATVLHHAGQQGDFDPNFFADVGAQWRVLLEGTVRCDHAGDGRGEVPGAASRTGWLGRWLGGKS